MNKVDITRLIEAFEARDVEYNALEEAKTNED